jgi:hypothetical protein
MVGGEVGWVGGWVGGLDTKHRNLQLTICMWLDPTHGFQMSPALSQCLVLASTRLQCLPPGAM